nr:YceI family protein [Cardiobacterium valvarum]
MNTCKNTWKAASTRKPPSNPPPGKTAQLTGELTFHGKTQSITVPVSKVGEGSDPWGGYRSGFSTAFDLKPADYGANIEVAPLVKVSVSGEGIRAGDKKEAAK